MKESKKDPYEERVKKLLTISDNLKMTLVRNALRYKLSPSESLLVAAHFSAVLCLSISKHFDVDLSRVFETFNNTMKESIKIEKS